MAELILMPPVRPAPRDRLLTEAEVAEYLHLKPHTLAQWRCHRRNRPPQIKLGRQWYYPLSKLEAWVESLLEEQAQRDAAGG